MSRHLLDPKLDIVFWMLFGAERNRELLISLLNAVLKPSVPIVAVEVLPAEPERGGILDKHIALDIRCRLANGEQIDVEMQSQKRPAQRHRWLYYWARLYSGQLQRGSPYTSLRRTVVIVIANFEALERGGLHSSFFLQERRTGELLSDHCELHFIELPRLREALGREDEPELVNWARFLNAESDEELEQLAMESPILKQAQQALSALSKDDEARMRAEQREMALISNELDLAAAREQGLSQGKAEGLAEGKAEGLAEGKAEGLAEGKRQALRQLLSARYGELPPEVQRRLSDADAAQLERWMPRVLVAETLQAIFE